MLVHVLKAVEYPIGFFINSHLNFFFIFAAMAIHMNELAVHMHEMKPLYNNDLTVCYSRYKGRSEKVVVPTAV